MPPTKPQNLQSDDADSQEPRSGGISPIESGHHPLEMRQHNPSGSGSNLATPASKSKRSQSRRSDQHDDKTTSAVRRALPAGIQAMRTKKSTSEGKEEEDSGFSKVSATETMREREKYSIRATRDLRFWENGELQVLIGGQATPRIYYLWSTSGTKEVVGKTYRPADQPAGRAIRQAILEEAAQREFENEVSMLKAIGPYSGIVGLFEHDIVEAPEQTLFMEYHPYGDLCAWMNKITGYGYLPEVLLWKVLYELAGALAFLHYGRGTPGYDSSAPYERSYSFVHRDIKSENILVAGPECHQPTIRQIGFKLCDFGFALKFDRDSHERPERWAGTQVYQAPESAHFPYLATPKADVYGLGAVLHDMFSFMKPLATPCNKDCDEQYYRACKRHAMANPIPNEPESTFVGNDELEGGYSKCVMDMIRRCLSIDPELRPTAVDLCIAVEPIYRDIQFGKYDDYHAGSPLPLDNMRSRNGLSRWVRNFYTE